jgi:nicotinamide-nucleotide amidase
VTAALEAAGMPIAARVYVEDDEAALEQALAPEAVMTVVVAGPGGSPGDVVRRAIARATATRLVLNERMLAALEKHHRRRDRPLPRRAERLALLPHGVTLWTTDGGEPGWVVESAGAAFVVLPRGQIDRALADHLTAYARERLGGRPAVIVRTLKTAGVSLEEVEERLVDRRGWAGAPAAMKDSPVSVATVPAPGEVWVRLSVRAGAPGAAAAALASVEASVLDALGADCYGRDGETLEGVVGRLLVERGLTLAVAESCTGGLLGHRLTNNPGSSAYFERGIVVYSNRAKQELLGVPASVLERHGAVSAPCAEAMARGICERSASACGVAITGIAGPEGGSAAKPVGTVFVGLAISGDVVSRRFRFDGDRAAVKWQSAQMALDMLRRGLARSGR